MQMNLEAIDTDGAIREAAEEVAGDTRLAFLRKGAMAGGAALSGGAILSALVPGRALAAGRPPSSFGKGDIGILNYALTLEYLEAAFYNAAHAAGSVKHHQLKQFLNTVVADENAHVKLLKSALGSKAAKKPKFDFQGIPKHEAEFAQTAFVLENTGVHAYLGQAANIKKTAVADHGSGDRHDRGAPRGRHRPLPGQVDRPQRLAGHPPDRREVLAAVKSTGFIVG